MSAAVENLMDIEEEVDRRIQAVNSFFMNSDHIKKILEMIHALRLRGFRGDGSAMCMQISGPTGAGKTMLFQRYLARTDAQRTDDHVPVLCFKMPTRYTEPVFLGTILEAYGARSFNDRQNPHQLAKRVRDLITAKRTELIMIEDLQHVIDQKERTAKIPYYAADEIKAFLLDDVKVPVVFNGLTIADQLFIRNRQLRMRRRYNPELKPFDWKDALSREQFTIMVRLFARRAEFQNYAELEDSLVERIWRATGGVPGELATLFKAAAELGVRRGVARLTQELLAIAHAENADVDVGWKNVFTLAVLPRNSSEDEPDQSRVTKLTKGIARVGKEKGAR